MAGSLMDGKGLKRFVEDDKLWAQFVDDRFSKLDKNHNGKLTRTDLEPAISGVGKALGMPPMGTDPDTDHIYTEMFSEFGPGGEGVTKETFSRVMRDIMLGLGDGLEREPVVVSPLNGSELERFVRGPEFEVEAVAAFSALDTDTSGQLKAATIKKAMQRLTVNQGMPPQTDSSVSKYIDSAFQQSGVNPEHPLNQAQFVDAYKKVALAVASFMRNQPMMVAHSDKVFDGTSITNLLKDKHALDLALDLAWEIMPKTGNGQAPKSYLRVGLDTLAPYAGLPPVGAVPEMDSVVNECFKMIDEDSPTGRVDQEGFNKSMLEVLGGVMLQLQGKPINVKSSAVVPPAREGSLTSGMPF